MRQRFLLWLVIACLAPVTSAMGMGLRAFVALPVDAGGAVLRLFGQHSTDRDVSVLTTSLAYGIARKHTLFLGLPYRVSPSGGDRLGDLSVLYRYTLWQVDQPGSTSRLGLLGGVILPTDNERDARVQAGAVATFFRGRREWDLDVLWVEGLNAARDAARYDVSWQYRLAPARYPEWGSVPEWWGVLELNGRWLEGDSMVHQITAGLQWVHRRWVLEGGVVRDLNGPEDTQLVLSMRIHF